jgi:hypothetical protein
LRYKIPIATPRLKITTPIDFAKEKINRIGLNCDKPKENWNIHRIKPKIIKDINALSCENDAIPIVAT